MYVNRELIIKIDYKTNQAYSQKDNGHCADDDELILVLKNY